jgi:predicted oxidoreductase (fatty acid repression mutant protein)
LNETPTAEKSLRRRINIKETAKHERYWDISIDATGYTLAEQMQELDAAVAEAEKRCIETETVAYYPPADGTI